MAFIHAPGNAGMCLSELVGPLDTAFDLNDLIGNENLLRPVRHNDLMALTKVPKHIKRLLKHQKKSCSGEDSIENVATT